MSATQESGLLFAEERTTARDEPSFRLASLEVFNWGSFAGKHSCDFDARGAAIVGPTGSGKTTLVDALMTLLAPNPSYNLASTGGQESDRDIISYVRGVSGAERANGETDHVARPGKTLSGLGATYDSGTQLVSIGVVFWVDSGSNASDDLKRVWFFSKDIARPLDQLLQLHHEEGKKAITRFGKETVGLRLYNTKKEFLAQLRDFFEVGENAFSLLNRAAGLKQIHSIDDVFRQLVLDDRSAFGRALEVVSEFDTLEGIYQELQTARRQRDSLLPVRTLEARLSKIRATLDALLEFHALLPPWFADAAQSLWRSEIERISDDKAKAQRRLDDAGVETERLERRAEQLKEHYLQLGGSSIQEMEERIATQEQLAALVRKRADDYRACARNLGLPENLKPERFRENLETLQARAAAYQEELDKARAEHIANESRLRDAREEGQKLNEEIEAVKRRPTSNIPPRHKAFQEDLAAQLKVAPTRIPFVAELIEVKPDESRWRGAIERAIGPERLLILVPEEMLQPALNWIDQRDNKLHVRLQSATPVSKTANFYADGFTRKLNFREHPLRENVKHLLALRDRHCVDSVEALRRTEHAMTIEGLMSDRDGRFEKQDQRTLGENWMTGFDNKLRLKSLADRALELQSNMSQLKDESQKCSSREDAARAKLTMAEAVGKLDFGDIDLPGNESELAALRARLTVLMDPDSDTALAKRQSDEAQLELKASRAHSNELHVSLGELKAKLGVAESGLKKARGRLATGLTEEPRTRRPEIP